MKNIEIGGKVRPVKYSINALADFNLNTGTDLDWIFKVNEKPLSMDMNHLRWLVFVGLKFGAIENKETVDFNVDMVGKWLDTDLVTFPEFMEALREGMPVFNGTKKK